MALDEDIILVDALVLGTLLLILRLDATELTELGGRAYGLGLKALRPSRTGVLPLSLRVNGGNSDTS